MQVVSITNAVIMILNKDNTGWCDNGTSGSNDKDNKDNNNGNTIVTISNDNNNYSKMLIILSSRTIQWHIVNNLQK